MRLVGYVRVSTVDQAENGAGLAAQRETITDACDQRGWQLVTVCEDAGVSGSSSDGRLGLQEALAAVESGHADGLVVAKLDRLSRSLVDFAALMARSREQGWALVALDLGVDTSTPAGEMMANVLASFAQFERRLIGQRTREALAVKRAQGVRLGRPRVLTDTATARAAQLRAAGLTFRQAADQLNAEGVVSAQGGRWWPSTVRRAVHHAASSAR